MATSKLKTNIELAELLGIRDLPFYERITILTKAIWKKMTSDFSFNSEQKYTSLKEVFDNTKKGSRNYNTNESSKHKESASRDYQHLMENL